MTTLAPELLRRPASSSSEEVDDESPFLIDEVPFFNEGLMGRDPDCGMTSVDARCFAAAWVDGPGPADADGEAGNCGAGAVLGEIASDGDDGGFVVVVAVEAGCSAKTLRGLNELASPFSSARLGKRGMMGVRLRVK